MNIRDKFLKMTEGTTVEKRVKLRESIFRENTGKWPCHLPTDRSWFEGTFAGQTWR